MMVKCEHCLRFINGQAAEEVVVEPDLNQPDLPIQAGEQVVVEPELNQQQVVPIEDPVRVGAADRDPHRCVTAEVQANC